MDLLDFHSTYKILLSVYLKRSSFCISADVKPMPNDVMHALPWQCACMLYLSVYILQFLLFTRANLKQICFKCDKLLHFF